MYKCLLHSCSVLILLSSYVVISVKGFNVTDVSHQDTVVYKDTTQVKTLFSNDNYIWEFHESDAIPFTQSTLISRYNKHGQPIYINVEGCLPSDRTQRTANVQLVNGQYGEVRGHIVSFMNFGLKYMNKAKMNKYQLLLKFYDKTGMGSTYEWQQSIFDTSPNVKFVKAVATDGTSVNMTNFNTFDDVEYIQLAVAVPLWGVSNATDNSEYSLRISVEKQTRDSKKCECFVIDDINLIDQPYVDPFVPDGKTVGFCDFRADLSLNSSYASSQRYAKDAMGCINNSSHDFIPLFYAGEAVYLHIYPHKALCGVSPGQDMNITLVYVGATTCTDTCLDWLTFVNMTDKDSIVPPQDIEVPLYFSNESQSNSLGSAYFVFPATVLGHWEAHLRIGNDLIIAKPFIATLRTCHTTYNYSNSLFLSNVSQVEVISYLLGMPLDVSSSNSYLDYLNDPKTVADWEDIQTALSDKQLHLIVHILRDIFLPITEVGDIEDVMQHTLNSDTCNILDYYRSVELTRKEYLISTTFILLTSVYKAGCVWLPGFASDACIYFIDKAARALAGKAAKQGNAFSSRTTALLSCSGHCSTSYEPLQTPISLSCYAPSTLTLQYTMESFSFNSCTGREYSSLLLNKVRLLDTLVRDHLLELLSGGYHEQSGVSAVHNVKTSIAKLFGETAKSQRQLTSSEVVSVTSTQGICSGSSTSVSCTCPDAVCSPGDTVSVILSISYFVVAEFGDNFAVVEERGELLCPSHSPTPPPTPSIMSPNIPPVGFNYKLEGYCAAAVALGGSGLMRMASIYHTPSVCCPTIVYGSSAPHAARCAMSTWRSRELLSPGDEHGCWTYISGTVASCNGAAIDIEALYHQYVGAGLISSTHYYFYCICPLDEVV